MDEYNHGLGESHTGVCSDCVADGSNDLLVLIESVRGLGGVDADRVLEVFDIKLLGLSALIVLLYWSEGGTRQKSWNPRTDGNGWALKSLNITFSINAPAPAKTEKVTRFVIRLTPLLASGLACRPGMLERMVCFVEVQHLCKYRLSEGKEDGRQSSLSASSIHASMTDRKIRPYQ